LTRKKKEAGIRTRACRFYRQVSHGRLKKITRANNEGRKNSKRKLCNSVRRSAKIKERTMAGGVKRGSIGRGEHGGKNELWVYPKLGEDEALAQGGAES